MQNWCCYFDKKCRFRRAKRATVFSNTNQYGGLDGNLSSRRDPDPKNALITSCVSLSARIALPWQGGSVTDIAVNYCGG